MPLVDSFIVPTPDAWRDDAQINAYIFQLTMVLDQLLRPEGAVATGEATTATVLTQGEKLDLIGVTQTVDLDTIESETTANTSALASLLDNLPAYSVTNDGTDRTFSADAAAGAITNPPTQAEVENLRDTLLEIADVLATVIRDLRNKDVFGP